MEDGKDFNAMTSERSSSTVPLALLRHELFKFICSLFTEAFGRSNYITSNERMIMNDEVEKTWKGAAISLRN